MDRNKHATGKRKWKQISENERYKIEALHGQGLTPIQIGEALYPKRDRRTIERELARGPVEQKRLNPSSNKYAPMYIVERVYKADTAQMRHNERAADKGRGLKIGHDQKLADCIEKKTKDGKWSPDTVIGRLKAEGWGFKTAICTKTAYNYIGKGVSREVTNKGLWVKKRRRQKAGLQKNPQGGAGQQKRQEHNGAAEGGR
jgi:IS30 family transposase